jgi:hypothetical protein
MGIFCYSLSILISDFDVEFENSTLELSWPREVIEERSVCFSKERRIDICKLSLFKLKRITKNGEQQKIQRKEEVSISCGQKEGCKEG